MICSMLLIEVVSETFEVGFYAMFSEYIINNGLKATIIHKNPSSISRVNLKINNLIFRLKNITDIFIF